MAGRAHEDAGDVGGERRRIAADFGEPILPRKVASAEAGVQREVRRALKRGERNRLAGSAKNYSLRAVNANGATVGEQLNVVMLADDWLDGALVGTSPLTVGGANAVGRTTLQLAETRMFTRGDETVSIPTDYIDAQEALFAFYRGVQPSDGYRRLPIIVPPVLPES